MKIVEHSISTGKEGLYDITEVIQKEVVNAGCREGIAVIYCPHTTAAVTINENGDPDVKKDLLFALHTFFPYLKEYKHMEGNSPAHLKASMIGASEQVIIHNGRPLLGTWQSIYFCEFDGPRSRKFYVKIIAG